MEPTSKEIALQMKNVLSDLEKVLEENNKKYTSDLNTLKDLKHKLVEDYSFAKDELFAKARKDADDENFSFSSLEEGLKIKKENYQNGLNSIIEFDKGISNEYNSSVDSAILSHLSRSTSLIEKRIKDYYNAKNGVGVDPKEFERAKLKLKELHTKHFRKEIKRGTPIGKDLLELKKKAEEIVHKSEKNYIEKDAINKYSIEMPVIFKSSNGEKINIEVSIPLNVLPSEEFKVHIENSFLEEIIKLDSNAVNEKSPYIKFNFNTSSDKFSEFYPGILSKLENLFKEYNIKPKIYRITTKFVPELSIKEKITLASNTPSEENRIVALGEVKTYSIKETSQMTGINEGTLNCMLAGHSGYDNSHLEKYYIKTKHGKRTVRRITEEGIEFLKQGNYMRRKEKLPKHPKGLEKKVTTEVNAPEVLSEKDSLIEKGINYLRYSFKYNEKLPTIHTWNSKEVKQDDIKKYFKNFTRFMNSLMKSERGKNLRRDLEHELIGKGFSMKDISSKMKISYPTVLLDLKDEGLLAADTISRKYNSPEKIRTKQIYNFQKYDKDDLREKMLFEAINKLEKPEKINYLGLEGPNFGSLIYLSNLCEINPMKSLVAEHDNRAYNAMACIIRNNRKIDEGEIFNKLNLYKGDVADAINDEKYKGFKFNFINLDYDGSLGVSKLKSIESLFENKMIADDSILFITLNEHPRRVKVSETKPGINDYSSEIKKCIAEYAIKNYGNSFKIENICEQHYRSRTGKQKTPMLMLGFKFKNE